MPLCLFFPSSQRLKFSLMLGRLIAVSRRFHGTNYPSPLFKLQKAMEFLEGKMRAPLRKIAIAAAATVTIAVATAAVPTVAYAQHWHGHGGHWHGGWGGGFGWGFGSGLALGF